MPTRKKRYLSNLFQEIKTSDYFPMVKYVKNGETQSYNIYKPFFRNVNQTGGTGGNVNFVVDGGTATTVSSDIIIFLDGGSA
ncbi:MAG: hypothetical protein ACO3MB_11170 [Saprospiraceae bacterium]